MNRRRAIAAFGALCAAPLRFAGAEPVAKTMTAADVHVDGYPTVEAVRFMSRRIEAQTDGRLKIRVYHAGQLGRESDTVDLARFGALDITRVNFAPLNNPFPGTQVFSLPYVFESVEHFRRAADGARRREGVTAAEARVMTSAAGRARYARGLVAGVRGYLR